MNGELVIRTSKESKRDIDVADTYRLVFPYKHIDAEVQRNIVDIAERVYEIKETVEKNSNFDHFDAVMFSLRYIRDTYPIDFSECKFVDCFGYSGAAAFYASSFEFETVLGIEFSKDGYRHAVEIKDDLYDNLHSSTKLSFECGSFQDFFAFDANVVFLDCAVAGADSMLDEGVFLKTLFFPMCKKLLSGSFIVVVTETMTLHTADCVNMAFPYECVCDKPINPHHEYLSSKHGQRYPKHLWILRTSWSSAS